jgi:ABC-type microcin C transport system permease subunit YejE
MNFINQMRVLSKVEMSLLVIMYGIWIDLGVVKCRKIWNPIMRMFLEIIVDHYTKKNVN